MRLARQARGLMGILGLLAGGLLFAMMALTFADVFGRYLFNSPIPGAFELTEIMMGLLIFAGLPLISADEGHVVVSLLDGVLDRRGKWGQALLRNAVGAVVAAMICVVLWEKATTLAGYGDVTAYLRIPKAPVAYAMSALSAVTAAVFAYRMWRHWLLGLYRDEVHSETDSWT